MDDPFYHNVNIQNTNQHVLGEGFTKVKNIPLYPIEENMGKKTIYTAANKQTADIQYINQSSEQIIYEESG